LEVDASIGDVGKGGSGCRVRREIPPGKVARAMCQQDAVNKPIC